MPKIKIKYEKGEAREIMEDAQRLSDNLICHHGSRKAYLIVRSVYEKVFANYKRMERKYPNEKVN